MRYFKVKTDKHTQIWVTTLSLCLRLCPRVMITESSDLQIIRMTLDLKYGDCLNGYMFLSFDWFKKKKSLRTDAENVWWYCHKISYEFGEFLVTSEHKEQRWTVVMCRPSGHSAVCSGNHCSSSGTLWRRALCKHFSLLRLQTQVPHLTIQRNKTFMHNIQSLERHDQP